MKIPDECMKNIWFFVSKITNRDIQLMFSNYSFSYLPKLLVMIVTIPHKENTASIKKKYEKSFTNQYTLQVKLFLLLK